MPESTLNMPLVYCGQFMGVQTFEATLVRLF
jgi:hypothetical protein